jgi:excisionase family DNA binding protein
LKEAHTTKALPPVPPMLTVADVAARLQLCTKTVRRAIEDGELHVHQIGRQHRIAEDDLLLFIAKR